MAGVTPQQPPLEILRRVTTNSNPTSSAMSATKRDSKAELPRSESKPESLCPEEKTETATGFDETEEVKKTELQ